MRSAVAALLLAAAALAAWWWWPDAPSAPRAPRSAAHSDTAAAASAGSTAAPAGPVAAGRELVAVADPVPLPRDAVMVDVQVVDESTSEPIAGADVRWSDATTEARVAALPAAEREPFADDDELAARRFGWHAVTDARGTVRVHAHPQATRVVARTVDRHGFIDVRRQDAGTVVVLRVGRDLVAAVRVVDGSARPLHHVPVHLGRDTRGTDAAGVVVFRHLQYLVERDRDGTWLPRDARVSIAIPGYEHDGATFPLLSPPASPLVLVLRDTGSLHVRVAAAECDAGDIDADIRADGCVDERGNPVQWVREADPDRVVRFPYVPLSRSFGVRVRIGSLELARTVAGPVTAGQVVEATFEVPRDAVVLTGRVVDRDGAPVAAAELSLEYSTGGEFGSRALRTDARGRFVWHVNETPADEHELYAFVLSWRRAPLDVRFGRVAPRRLKRGVDDVGDVALAPLPLVVGGRFEFEAGRADERVPMRVERWIDGASAGEPGRWQFENGLEQERDDDGRFEVRGSPDAGRLRLVLGDLARPVEFERGTEGLVVRILRGHAVTIVCRLPRGLDVVRIHYMLTADSTELPRAVREEGAGEWNQRAVMHEEGLPAGVYSLCIRCENVPDPLATERIELPGPGGERDRTIELDLGARVPVVRLHVAGPGGEVPKDVVAFVDQDEQSGLRFGIRVANGELTWPVADRPVDVTIVGTQWRTQVLRAVRGDVDVRLERAPMVALRAAGVPALPPGHTIVVTVDAGPGRGGEPSLPLAGGESVQLRALRGESSTTSLTNGVAWTVRATDDERGIAASLEINGVNWPLHTVPAKLPPGAGSCTIAFDAAEILAAIDASKKLDAEKQR